MKLTNVYLWLPKFCCSPFDNVFLNKLDDMYLLMQSNCLLTLMMCVSFGLGVLEEGVGVYHCGAMGSQESGWVLCYVTGDETLCC